MQTLMTALMTWIAAHSGLPIPDGFPSIVYADQASMEALSRQEPEEGALHQSAPRLVAMYRSDLDMMVLPLDWSVDSVRDVSVLLHELVHFMQDQAIETGDLNKYPCYGAAESPAYAAQFDWLRGAGLDPYEVLETNGLTVMAVTSCGGVP